MKLRIASPVICDSIVDGPGLRMVIWTQGCKHNCKGCHNPQTHSLTKGYEVDTKESSTTIAAAAPYFLSKFIKSIFFHNFYILFSAISLPM